MVQCRKTLWNPKSLDSALDYFFWCIICWLFYCFYKCRAQALLRLMGSKAKWSQATNSEGFSSTIQSDLFGSCKSNVNSILLISYYYFVPSSKLLPFIFAKVYILVRLYTFYCKFFLRSALSTFSEINYLVPDKTNLHFWYLHFLRQIYKKINQRFVKICIKLQTIAFTTILKWALWISGFYIKQKIFKSGSFFKLFRPWKGKEIQK